MPLDGDRRAAWALMDEGESTTPQDPPPQFAAIVGNDAVPLDGDHDPQNTLLLQQRPQAGGIGAELEPVEVGGVVLLDYDGPGDDGDAGFMSSDELKRGAIVEARPIREVGHGAGQDPRSQRGEHRATQEGARRSGSFGPNLDQPSP